jgi:hypothetical protein
MSSDATFAGVPMDQIRSNQTSYQDPNGPPDSGWSITPMRYFIGLFLIMSVAVLIYLPLKDTLNKKK